MPPVPPECKVKLTASRPITEGIPGDVQRAITEVAQRCKCNLMSIITTGKSNFRQVTVVCLRPGR